MPYTAGKNYKSMINLSDIEKYWNKDGPSTGIYNPGGSGNFSQGGSSNFNPGSAIIDAIGSNVSYNRPYESGGYNSGHNYNSGGYGFSTSDLRDNSVSNIVRVPRDANTYNF